MSRLEANDYHIMDMLEDHSHILDLRDSLMEDIYSEDWEDIKHMPIDNACMETDLDDVKKIVDEYGVFETLDLIRGNYGDELIISLMGATIDMRYRTLFYHILDEYIEKSKTFNMDDDDDEANRSIYTCGSDTASDAETDEESDDDTK